MTDIACKTFRTTGVCTHSSHLTPITIGGSITGSCSSVYADDLLIARAGDTVTSDCGHTGTIDDPGTKYVVEDANVARIGDSFSGTYSGTIISPTSTVETA